MATTATEQLSALTKEVVTGPVATLSPSWLSGSTDQTNASESAATVSATVSHPEEQVGVAVKNSAPFTANNAGGVIERKSYLTAKKSATDRRIMTTLSGCYITWRHGFFFIQILRKRTRSPSIATIHQRRT